MQDVLSSTSTGLENVNFNGEAAPPSASIPRSIETSLDVKATVPVSNAPITSFQENGEGATMTDTTMSNSEAPNPSVKQSRASRPYKRRKKSPVPSYRNFMVRTADQFVQPEINLEEMPFDKTDLDDIQAAVQVAQTKRQTKFNLQLQNHAVSMDRMKKSYEAALARANRRAAEATERHRIAIHDLATLKKSNKLEMAESIASVRAEMTEEHAKMVKAKAAENPDVVMAVKDSEPKHIVLPTNVIPAESLASSINGFASGPVIDPTSIPTNAPTTDPVHGTADAPANEPISGSLNSQSEVADLQARLDISAQLLEKEQSSRRKDSEIHADTITRLTNEIQNLRNAQMSSQLIAEANEKKAEELKEFDTLKGDIMQLARQFPNIIPIDPGAEWSSAKIGMALQDLVHSRLKQEAQVKVHELFDQRQA